MFGRDTVNWQDQNKIGIAWNQVYETIRMMWGVYYRTGDPMAKIAADQAADQFIRMSGQIDS